MKDRTEAHARTKGLFNITVTPFTSDGSFDFRALAENIERVISIGYDGLLIGGTYGEFPTMTADERVGLFRAAMDAAGDRVPVLLCTAHSDVRVARELTAQAGELGGLPMVTAPYVSEITEEQIETFFVDMATRSRTGIMVYNAPGIGITLSPGLIDRLADIDGVVALKQGDLNPTVVDQLASTVVGRIRVLAASDLVFLGPLAAGFDGLSSTNSCALPEIIHATYKAQTGGDPARAAELHRRWYPLRALARRYGQPQTTKAIMNLRGWTGGHVRAPLLDLNAERIAEVEKALASVAGGSDFSFGDLSA